MVKKLISSSQEEIRRSNYDCSMEELVSEIERREIKYQLLLRTIEDQTYSRTFESLNKELASMKEKYQMLVNMRFDEIRKQTDFSVKHLNTRIKMCLSQ